LVDFSNETGTFAGTRLGGDLEATFRFSGVFTGDDAGLFILDIDDTNEVTGRAYSVITADSTTISGTVDDGALNATTGDGTTISADIPVGLARLDEVNEHAAVAGRVAERRPLELVAIVDAKQKRQAPFGLEPREHADQALAGQGGIELDCQAR